MPKNTFTKISQEKKERLLKQAAGLFAERGFAATDMAELAARAGVAKGSLYNYFDSKDDLYLYVCRDGLERSRQAVYGGLDPSWDIYRQIEHIFRRGVEFSRKHPEYVSLYLNVSSAGMERFAKKLTREVESHTAEHLKSLIRSSMEAGVVRPDLDVNHAAFLINSLYIVFLASMVSPHYQIRAREYLEIKGRIQGKALEDSLKRTINFVQNLLRPTASPQIS